MSNLAAYLLANVPGLADRFREICLKQKEYRSLSSLGCAFEAKDGLMRALRKLEKQYAEFQKETNSPDISYDYAFGEGPRSCEHPVHVRVKYGFYGQALKRQYKSGYSEKYNNEPKVILSVEVKEENLKISVLEGHYYDNERPSYDWHGGYNGNISFRDRSLYAVKDIFDGNYLDLHPNGKVVSVRTEAFFEKLDKPFEKLAWDVLKSVMSKKDYSAFRAYLRDQKQQAKLTPAP